MANYSIRLIGDPVLRSRSTEVTDINDNLKQLVDGMISTMKLAPGVGLAAPQVGVLKRVFVYDVGDGPHVVINPVIRQSSGEWEYEEGCLSVPGFSWRIVRPNHVHLCGYDLDENEVDIEASEFLGRVIQHEVDHLDGILLVERLEPDVRKEAMRMLRKQFLISDEGGSPTGSRSNSSIPVVSKSGIL
ncbi:MAG: peptide deformylase [Actinobacteria bacterium]|nr:peptide deformylase [Actinomycetota bacterium]